MNSNSPAPSSRERSLDRLFRSVLAVAALWVLTAATIISFCRIFQGWDYLLSFFIMATVAHGAAFGLRQLKISFVSSLAATTLVVYATTSYLLLRNTLTFGLPLSSTWSVGWERVLDSWTQLGDVVPPLAEHSGFGIVSLISVGLAAFLADSFAFRFAGHVEALVPTAVIFVVLAAVGVDRNRSSVAAFWVGAAIVALSILRLHRTSAGNGAHHGGRTVFTPVRSMALVTFMAVTTSLIAMAVGPRLPGAGEEALLSSGRGVAGPRLEPLVDVRGRLTDPGNSVLFSVVAEFGSYWRMTSLPTFDGRKWTVSQDRLNTAGGNLADTDFVSDVGVATSDHIQLFTIENLSGSFAPVADRPVQLRSASRSLFYEPETGTLLVGQDGLRAKDQYEILSTTLVPSVDSLIGSTSKSPPDAEYLEVPASPEIFALREIVDEIISGTTGNYERLLALQSYFRDNFEYSLEVPPSTSSDATLEFLLRKSGYCEQFSSTFALFARLIGLPSRVAIGFTPGEAAPLGTSGVETYTVRSQHAHAWPEIWFDEIGWVLFEPTPGRGAPMADYTNVAPEQDETPAGAAPTTTTTTPTITSTIAATDQSAPTTSIDPIGGSTSGVDDDSGHRTGLTILGIVVFLIAVWLLALRRVVEYAVERREPKSLLRLWRIAVFQFECAHGKVPAPLSVREIGAMMIGSGWSESATIHRITQTLDRFLFRSSQSPDDYSSDYALLAEFIKQQQKHLPRRTLFASRIRPTLAWKLAGGVSGKSSTR